MSKRKAGVNDIIYELDNDDIEISSEDEVKEAKIHRLEAPKACSSAGDEAGVLENGTEVINLDSTAEDCVILSPSKAQNGGKTSPDVTVVEPIVETSTATETPNQTEELDSTKKLSNCPNTTTILNEDIVVDSPASNSDLGVVGCENRTPLVTVRFKDKKMAKAYKEKVKTFMLNLIKLHDEENLTGSETETDLELDVWPEDLQDSIEEPMQNVVMDPLPTEEPTDNLFFVDTAPGGMEYVEKVPMYRQNTTLISNIPDKEPSPPPTRRGPTCFNCEGAHSLRDCTQPRNNMRINERRKQMVKLGRYHVEDDQKFGHLVPGRISGQLRHALGLKRHELPMFIYKMRQLGYPPGWLEEARISHSGITMFDSTMRQLGYPPGWLEEARISHSGITMFDSTVSTIEAHIHIQNEAAGLPARLARRGQDITLRDHHV
ncbi:PSP domain-containing protein [Phthorimaea operculella]|nr:PSP domain-containing protein [Phthorimaea operculella]